MYSVKIRGPEVQYMAALAGQYFRKAVVAGIFLRELTFEEQIQSSIPGGMSRCS
jgi:hypothetical protein